MMSDENEISFPIVIFHDDGARVYHDRGAACASQEVRDVRSNRKWFGYGYDAAGVGVRLVVADAQRSAYGAAGEKIELRLEPELEIDSDEDARLWLREYLDRLQGEAALRGSLSSVRDLLGRVLQSKG